MTSSRSLTAPMSANGCQKRVVAVVTAMAEDGIALRRQRPPKGRADRVDRLARGSGDREPAEEAVDRARPADQLGRDARLAQRLRVRLALVAQDVLLGGQDVRG